MKQSPTVKANLELLGVDAQVTQKDLKKAYHRLALLYHPDRNTDPNAVEEFRKITIAYEFLSDPARVADANRRHLKEKMHRQVVDGLEFTFGTFFGYRLFQPEGTTQHVRISGKTADKTGDRFEWPLIEENNSILDHAAYDALEVVYAGRHSRDDEDRLSSGGKKKTNFNSLPWVMLNNQGILRFLDGDIRRAKKCYEELARRVPGNIIFLYRWGICLVIEGFREPKKTLLGGVKPDRSKVNKGIEILEACIRIGEERTVGKQKCLVIKKVLADVLMKTGQKSRARKLWKEIREQDPSCAEAAFYLNEKSEAQRLAMRKASGIVEDNSAPSFLLTAKSR